MSLEKSYSFKSDFFPQKINISMLGDMPKGEDAKCYSSWSDKGEECTISLHYQGASREAIKYECSRVAGALPESGEVGRVYEEVVGFVLDARSQYFKDLVQAGVWAIDEFFKGLTKGPHVDLPEHEYIATFSTSTDKSYDISVRFWEGGDGFESLGVEDTVIVDHAFRDTTIYLRKKGHLELTVQESIRAANRILERTSFSFRHEGCQDIDMLSVEIFRFCQDEYRRVIDRKPKEQ